VAARHRHVVEEDRAAGVATDGRLLVLQQERRSSVRATLDQQERLPGRQLVVGEGELLVPFIVAFDRGEGDGDVFVQWIATVDAEARVVPVGMSTAATEQREQLLGPRVPSGSRLPEHPRPCPSARPYPTAPKASR